MVVAVNTRLLLKDRLDGMGRFAFEILKRMTAAHPEVKFLFLFDRKYNEEFIFSKNVTPLVVSPQARHPLLWYWWLEQALPKVFLKYEPDLFFSPDGFLSLSYSAPAGSPSMKSVPVIHDLNFEHQPQNVPGLAGRFFRKNFPLYAKKADHIITVSEFSKRDICETYNIKPDKISVVHNAAHDGFRVLSDEEKEKVKARFSQGIDYFLFTGSIQPRKNLEMLLKAYDKVRQDNACQKKLLIAGAEMFKADAVRKVWNQMKFKNDVIFTGRLNDEDLCHVTGAAYAMVFIPVYEGFGIPVVEAMQCGVPVIASDVTSLPEVVGDAGILVDPDTIQSVCDAMKKISIDQPLHKDLSAKSLERAKSFNWDLSARSSWNVLEKLAIPNA